MPLKNKAKKEQIINTLSQSTDTFVKIANFKMRRRWYESVARQGDVQATVILYKNPYVSGFILESRYGKLSTHGKIGQHQIERGQLLVEMLEKQVRNALEEANWYIMHESDDKETEHWEMAETAAQRNPSEHCAEKPE